MDALSLLPRPRTLEPEPGQHTLDAGKLIVLDGPDPAALLGTARRLQSALGESTGSGWEISATTSGPEEQTGVVLRVAPDATQHDQGYELTITPDRVVVEASTPAGAFYGVCTLIQLVEQTVAQSTPTLPCVYVSDWPDHVARGVMLDVSRNKVPTMETAYALIDKLAGWKFNELQLYTEHTFAYRNHPEVWAGASPFTGEEILALDAYCRERFVELVPNQNSFGHLHRWLSYPRYAALAEVHGEFEVPWGTMHGPFSLAPVDPGSIELVSGLYDELLPHFSSRQVNVGCDETFDVGVGRSKAACEERGSGRVYLDFLLEIYRAVSERGRTMQFWGDIIERHPELIGELPKDVVALGWGYEADHPFGTLCERYAAAGLAFYTCPGTSSWNTIAGRTDNALGNLRSAAENGLRHGATGYLITDWGDNGHGAQLPVSYLGFAAGAAYSWAFDANLDLDVAEATSRHAFADPTGASGRLAYDLGNVYRAAGVESPNSSALFWLLSPLADLRASRAAGEGVLSDVSPEALRECLAAVDAAIEQLPAARSRAADAALVAEEYAFTARLLRHACRRGLLALDESSGESASELGAELEEMIEEYKRLWLARNRPGGLDDSVERLERLRADYA